MTRSYKVQNLQDKLNKSNSIAKAMKSAIDRHEGPTYAKNDLIRRYNKQVRISKSIKETLLDAIASSN